MNNQKLTLKFDLKTIQHLGSLTYSKLPPVLGELVANSWDADATKVTIEFNDEDPDNKYVIIRDNGIGMSFQDHYE